MTYTIEIPVFTPGYYMAMWVSFSYFVGFFLFRSLRIESQIDAPKSDSDKGLTTFWFIMSPITVFLAALAGIYYLIYKIFNLGVK